MSKLSIAEVRRRLAVGVTVKAVYLGTPIRVVGNTGTTMLPVTPPSLRKVVRQTADQMETEALDGEKKGKSVYCTWAGIKAREDGQTIVLAHKCYRGRDENGKDIYEMADFVSFEIVKEHTA